MTKHTFQFNIEGGDHVEFDLSPENFEKLSKICEEEFSEKKWRTKIIKKINA